jgi:hypothetical protein
MKVNASSISAILSLLILWSCSVSGYITDPESVKRQREMHNRRTGVNIGDGFLFVGSAVASAFTGIDFNTHPESQSYRKMKLLNVSKDTLFVNMVTDWQWKDSTYFDIREIVLPPKKSMKLVVPLGISYNVFFRNDYNAPDDEKLEINTASIRTLELKPGKERDEAQTNN